MTESEWLASDNPKRMLWWITSAGSSGSAEADLERCRQRPSDRKLRLFACACCRQVWHLLPESSHRAICAGERIADGIHDAAGWRAIHHDAVATANPGHLNFAPCYLGERDFDLDSVFADRPWPDGSPALHAALLRDIVGNPWRPGWNPAWTTSTVLSLARVIYDTRDFAALPILADALEDVGCDNEMLLRHCRGQELCPTCLGALHRYVPTASQSLQQCLTCMGEQPVWPTGWIPLRGPHARGCWALDLVLGKE